MSDYGKSPAVEEFQAALDELIGSYWPRIAPSFENGTLNLEEDPDVPTIPGGWVLVVAAQPIDPDHPDAVYSSARYSPAAQSPYLGIGLLADQVASWTAY